jgi:hypothetical protein
MYNPRNGGTEMDGLGKYLRKKHLDYCLEHGEVLAEREWVNILNEGLSKNDRLAYPSINQWMNGERMPDVNNIIRLINIFGNEIVPYVGIDFPGDLARLIQDWDQLPDETKNQIVEIAKENRSPSGELATIAA